MTKQGINPKKIKAMKEKNGKETSIEKVEAVQEEKHLQDEYNKENPIENGTGIIIVLLGDILLGGYLYRKQIAYKVNKEQFLLLERHAKILGVVIRMN